MNLLPEHALKRKFKHVPLTHYAYHARIMQSAPCWCCGREIGRTGTFLRFMGHVFHERCYYEMQHRAQEYARLRATFQHITMMEFV